MRKDTLKSTTFLKVDLLAVVTTGTGVKQPQTFLSPVSSSNYFRFVVFINSGGCLLMEIVFSEALMFEELRKVHKYHDECF